MNIQKMMKEMQKMQTKLASAQADLQNKEFTAEAGGGMVKLTLDGSGKLTELKIDPKAVDPDDVEALEDLLIAAFHSAFNQREAATQQIMGSVTGGMKIPGL